MIAGADGCPGGWLVLIENTLTPGPSPSEGGGNLTSTVTENLGTILAQHPDVLAVDIPIGIPSNGQRAADRRARALLKPRGSCVFPTPVRATFDALSYEHACDLHRQCDGRGLSKQAYMILDKIKQVDSLVRTHPNGVAIYEIHPEVSFAGMNGHPDAPHLSLRKALCFPEERRGFLTDQSNVRVIPKAGVAEPSGIERSLRQFPSVTQTTGYFRPKRSRYEKAKPEHREYEVLKVRLICEQLGYFLVVSTESIQHHVTSEIQPSVCLHTGKLTLVGNRGLKSPDGARLISKLS